MDTHHSPALDRLIRRQRGAVSDAGTVPVGAAAAGDSTAASAASSSSPAQQAAESTTTAAAQQSTTATTAATESTTTPAEVASSTSTTTTTTAAPVESSTTTSSTSSSTTTTTTTTTPTERSTTSTTSTTTTSATPTTTSAEQTQTAFSTAASTTILIVTGSAASSSSGTASLASSTAGSSSDSSLPTGGIIGIVAGAVVGVVFVAALIAYLFKKYSRRDDEDQISPFDKDEFRRASVMLDDDDAYAQSMHSYRNVAGGGHVGGHSPQMSEYSMSNVGVGVLPGLARGGTLHNPRPPTAILNHYQHQQMMPSFQPGQVVPTSPSPPMLHQPYAGAGPFGPQPGPMDPYAYGQPIQAPPPVQYADGGLSTAAAGNWNGAIGPAMTGGAAAGGALSRNNSQMSSYSQFSDGPYPQQQQQRQLVPGALRAGGGGSSGHGHPDERPLSLVHEDDEPYSPSHGDSFSRQQQQVPYPPSQQQQHGAIDYVPERSGTPTHSNVQQTFFGADGVVHGSLTGHRAERGRGTWEERSGRGSVVGDGGQDYHVEDHEPSTRRRRDGEQVEEEMEDDNAHGRRLGIRNRGIESEDEDERDDPYGGMH
ncbi:hypothetical protein JCM10212_003104 [Sporobolomyces blumeae]